MDNYLIYRITFLLKSNNGIYIQTIEEKLPIFDTTNAAFTLLKNRYGKKFENILDLECLEKEKI